VQVACPRCGAPALVCLGGDPPHRDLSCPTCADRREQGNTTEAWGGPVDPWFRQERWLRTEFGAPVVWAYHEDHARLLRDVVAAARRERTPTAGSRPAPMSMIERLSGWCRTSGNRARRTRILDELLERAA
jgi:hypothetical protein